MPTPTITQAVSNDVSAAPPRVVTPGKSETIKQLLQRKLVKYIDFQTQLSTLNLFGDEFFSAKLFLTRLKYYNNKVNITLVIILAGM